MSIYKVIIFNSLHVSNTKRVFNAMILNLFALQTFILKVVVSISSYHCRQKNSVYDILVIYISFIHKFKIKKLYNQPTFTYLKEYFLYHGLDFDISNRFKLNSKKYLQWKFYQHSTLSAGCFICNIDFLEKNQIYNHKEKILIDVGTSADFVIFL